MRRHCSLLQFLIVGWQPFTSVERRLTNFVSHWPYSATPMDHRNFRSSLSAEPGTLWHSIDRTQIRLDSITVTTRWCGWHLHSLMSEFQYDHCWLPLILPEGISKSLTSRCACEIGRSFYFSTISVVTTLITVQPTSDWSFSHLIWWPLSNHWMWGSSTVSKPTIRPCSVDAP